MADAHPEDQPTYRTGAVRLPAELTPLVLQGHVIEVLRSLPESSVQCVVTSPPYWGLRAYGTEGQVWGGEQDHAHEWVETKPRREREPDDAGGELQKAHIGASYEAQGGRSCSCGAWNGELGLEPTPDLYISHLADVFDEVRRVLREDGTLWLNLGDTYSGGNNGYNPGAPSNQGGASMQSRGQGSTGADRNVTRATRKEIKSGLPIKNLVGIPWRAAFELQRRGWFLRSDVIWSKPNPMPECVTDRPTRSHEYIFLLTKNARYYYDADAVRNPLAESTADRAQNHYSNPVDNPETTSKHGSGNAKSYPIQGRRQAGYAASTLREIEEGYDGRATKDYASGNAQDPSATKARIIEGMRAKAEQGISGANLKSVWQMATQPYPEAHFATFPEAIPERCLSLGSKPDDIVMDVFGGSGTTGQVARRLGRRSILIELNPEYVALARERSGANVPSLEAYSDLE